ncbi:exocyst complex component 3-like protein 4 isoform X2 [Hoplias malabaricus]
MAEKEENTYNGNVSPTSQISPTALRTLVRNLSVRSKNKRKEKEELQTEDTCPPSSTKFVSPDIQKDSPTSGGILQWVQKSFRKSSHNGHKNRRPPFQENNPSALRPEVTEVQRKYSNDRGIDFINKIPTKPVSVLQIDELLKCGDLEEAYLNLLSLRLEFQHKMKDLGEEAPSADLTKKEQNVSMLYKELRTKMTDIVQHSCDQTSKELLVHVACIIQEEEKREGDPGGIGGWRDAWRAAVRDGVRDTFNSVPLESKEQNTSWLPVHLGLLGKAIVEQREKVKTEIVSLYPPSFNVFETYVSFCHEFMEEHLKGLLEKVTEFKDYYAMLDFIINSYHSQKILGCPSLQPEMKEHKALTIPDAFLNQIKDEYFTFFQKVLQASLDNIIKLEQKDVWMQKATPQTTDDGRYLSSNIHMDICMIIASYAENTGKIDALLKKRVLCASLEALKDFFKRFEEEFTKQSSSLLGSDLLDCALWVQYHVAYINSFSFLKEKIEGYSHDCPDQVEQLGIEVDGLIRHLREALLQEFRNEIEPHLARLMTREWLNTDDSFNEIINRIYIYSGATKSMTSPSAQYLASDMHYHVVKEYISELLKNKYSCKGRKNEIAAAKIEQQWDELRKLFSEMGSTFDWLNPLGGHLSEIIKQENEKDIKNVLPLLMENYPDISEKQLSAILNFRDRGIGTYLKINPVIWYFNELKQNYGNKTHKNILFSDIK